MLKIFIFYQINLGTFKNSTYICQSFPLLLLDFKAHLEFLFLTPSYEIFNVFSIDVWVSFSSPTLFDTVFPCSPGWPGPLGAAQTELKMWSFCLNLTSAKCLHFFFFFTFLSLNFRLIHLEIFLMNDNRTLCAWGCHQMCFVDNTSFTFAQLVYPFCRGRSWSLHRLWCAIKPWGRWWSHWQGRVSSQDPRTHL